MKFYITDWKETADGFSAEPVVYEKDLNIKIRPYEIALKADGGLGKYNTRTLRLCLDRDLYISDSQYRELRNYFVFCLNQLITDNLLRSMENNIFDIIKRAFYHKEASFNPSDFPMYKIPKEPYFDCY